MICETEADLDENEDDWWEQDVVLALNERDNYKLDGSNLLFIIIKNLTPESYVYGHTSKFADKNDGYCMWLAHLLENEGVATRNFHLLQQTADAI